MWRCALSIPGAEDPDSLFPARAPRRWANGEGPWADLKLGGGCAQPVAAARLGPSGGDVLQWLIKWQDSRGSVRLAGIEIMKLPKLKWSRLARITGRPAPDTGLVMARGETGVLRLAARR